MAEADAIDVNRQFEKQPRVADYVVDADVHVTPPPTFWAEYLSPQFRDLAPKVEQGEDCDYIVFEGSRRAVNLMQSQAGRKFDEYKNSGKLSDMRVGGWMVDKRLDDMDRDGIDKAICFGGGPLGTGNLELYLDSFDAFNRWQSDFCADSNGRMFSCAYLTTIDVDQTIAGMKAATSGLGKDSRGCPGACREIPYSKPAYSPMIIVAGIGSASEAKYSAIRRSSRLSDRGS